MAALRCDIAAYVFAFDRKIAGSASVVLRVAPLDYPCPAVWHEEILEGVKFWLLGRQI